MTHFITVSALHGRHVARFRALFAHMTWLVAIATHHNARLLAFLAHMSLFATVTAGHWTTTTTSRTVLGEVAHLIALLALHSFG